VTFLVAGGGAVLRKECHNCVFKSGSRVSDTSFHMDYYTARFAKARDSRNRPWDKFHYFRFVSKYSENTCASLSHPVRRLCVRVIRGWRWGVCGTCYVCYLVFVVSKPQWPRCVP